MCNSGQPITLLKFYNNTKSLFFIYYIHELVDRDIKILETSPRKEIPQKLSFVTVNVSRRDT